MTWEEYLQQVLAAGPEGQQILSNLVQMMNDDPAGFARLLAEMGVEPPELLPRGAPSQLVPPVVPRPSRGAPGVPQPAQDIRGPRVPLAPGTPTEPQVIRVAPGETPPPGATKLPSRTGDLYLIPPTAPPATAPSTAPTADFGPLFPTGPAPPDVLTQGAAQPAAQIIPAAAKGPQTPEADAGNAVNWADFLSGVVAPEPPNVAIPAPPPPVTPRGIPTDNLAALFARLLGGGGGAQAPATTLSDILRGIL